MMLPPFEYAELSEAAACASGGPRLSDALKDYEGRSWEGQAIFLTERFAAAREEVDEWGQALCTGATLPPLAGMTMTVKACFDVEGWTTSCASRVLLKAPAAKRSAPLVALLGAAGAVLVAQTNMTEFAYGALGVNINFGTPRAPLDATGEQVAGGSSSGAAVAVARGYCDVSVCSDTSGSARIPAAFCGVVGFKPSRGRYPSEGMKWLSTSFDVPGVIARSVAACRLVDRVIAGGIESSVPASREIRLALPDFYSEVAIDEVVRETIDRCIRSLSQAGVTIVEIPLESLKACARAASRGGVIGYEAFRQHRDTLADTPHLYDPLIRDRLLKGGEVPEAVYREALEQVQSQRANADRELEGFDGFVLPTVPMMPPRLSEIAEQSQYLAANSRSFSLTEFANRVDLPSITLPVGGLPVGLMLTGTRGSDSRLLAIAEALAPIVADAT